MTALIDTAYAALCTALGDALVGAEFISAADRLEVDPTSACDPSGNEATVQTSAQIFSLDLDPIRPLIGGGSERWLVEGGYRLELAAFGPAIEGEPTFKERLSAAKAAVAVVPGQDPTLGQTCERIRIRESEDDDLRPNGMKVSVTFAIRLRSGDPLGQTAP